MDAVKGFLSTSGLGALIGAGLGWILFNATAEQSSTCVVDDASVCMEAFGMTFLPFVTLIAALGGLVGFVVLAVKGDIM
jgi:hypothetical protein